MPSLGCIRIDELDASVGLIIHTQSGLRHPGLGACQFWGLKIIAS